MKVWTHSFGRHRAGDGEEVRRLLSNFSVTFSIVSVLTGITTLYGTGLQFGGPVTMVYGWPIAGAFTTVVGLAMAEICSAYPTSGGLYFWSARLCSERRWGPFASWLTGWFNIVGQWAVTTSVDYSLAQLIQVIILLSTGGNNGGGYLASKYEVIAIHAAILLSHALINSLPIAWLSFFGQFAAAWNMLGVFVLMIAVPAVATERASAQSLGSLVAFQAMVSIATIGLYIAYALPIFFRVTLARKHFVPGPFNLGRYGVLVGWVAVLWVVTITVLFSLPVMYPVTRDTLNYTPVAVGGLFILVLTSWVVSARHWFKGPVTNLSG
uniref:Putative amino-acid permease n=1 Tax=Aegilops tauschii TaxID=37682 RepID=M8AYL4_AEGTA